MPNPPPMPVTKNAGGPPIGPLTAPNRNSDANWSSGGPTSPYPP